MKTKIKKSRRRSSRRPPSWLAMSAMSTAVACAAAGGKVASVSYAASPQPAGRQVQQSLEVFHFDISSELLDSVIPEFERVSGIHVVFSKSGLGGVLSSGVHGEYTWDQALQQILAGTGLMFRHTASNTVTLDVSPISENVDVTTAVPGISVASAKYTEPLSSVPQTIEMIPQQVLAEQGVTTLSEALRNVPGITLQAGEGGGASKTGGDMFNLRGFNASNSIFVDGVRDDGLIGRDVFNLEQVEVFMGPTGSDVGRGTAGGYVNMVTKSPHVDPTYSAQYEFGSANHRRLSTDLGSALPVGTSGGWLTRAAGRMNALWQDSGIPGRDFVKQNRQAIAPAITIGLGTPTRFTLAAEALRQNNIPDYGLPGAAWSRNQLTATTVRAGQAVNQSNYYGSPGYDYDRGLQNSYTARFERDINDGLTLRNQARYNDTYREAVVTSIQNVAAYDSAANLVAVSRQGNQQENKIFSNQANLTGRFSTGPLRHASSAGMEYSFEQLFTPTLTGLGTRAPVSIFNPDPYDVVTGYAPQPTRAFSKGRTGTASAYVFDTISVGARWQFSGGARLERYGTDFLTVDATGATTTNAHGSGNIVSGKAGVVFKINQSVNVYVSFGSTVTPPGTANFTLSTQANNQNNPDVKPQKSNNYEIGSKWDLAGGRLALSAAAFRTGNKNVVYTVDATAIPPVYNQDDVQKVSGLSLGITGRLTARWQILANFSYLDSRQETQNPANNGRRLTLTPKASSSAWTTYSLRGLVAGLGFRYLDTAWVDSPNTIQIPAYGVLDGMAEYSVNKHFTLRVNVYNMTDREYILNVNNNGARYNPGQPRSLIVTPEVRF